MDKNINEENEKAMAAIEDSLNNVICGYVRQFLGKFENFTNQMKVAEILLKAYEYRYNKIQGKVQNVNDIITLNSAHSKNFIEKCSKISSMENKMITIETKLGLISSKIDELLKLHKNQTTTTENKSTSAENTVSRTFSIEKFLDTNETKQQATENKVEKQKTSKET